MKKIIIYIVGLNFMALGIVLNISTGLGVAALSISIYATSQIFHLSLGTASIIWYLLFVVIQCCLSNKITKEYILEIPLSFVFGYLNDFYDYIINIHSSSYVESFLLLCLALLFISLGVYLTSETNLILNPGDGIVKTISTVFHQPFYNVKNIFDISMIVCSMTLSLVTQNPFMGIGIGTIISAFMIGRLIKIWTNSLQKRLFS